MTDVIVRLPTVNHVDVDDAYTAGIVDGEGCILITRARRNLQLRVVVSNTNLEVLERLQLNYRGSVHVRKIYEPRKQIYDWAVSGPDATELLRQIIPYLIIKEKEAKIAVQYPHWTRKGAGALHPGKGTSVPEDIRRRREELAGRLLAERRR
ncbi:hypothetical protein LCGC14_1184420 [marine sediment metagenome]|uniref:Homing endonuclease LAGLIDADG domain-containing protein n=1 Tax=marine sediment metagenome TaxID=412755 RepID=A0A0F9P451_9ZZZZ